MENRVYDLDHAATTKMSNAAFLEMQPYFCDIYANPSSVHAAGQRARAAVDEARNALAGCIGAKAEELYFTSGGTESDNLAVRMGAYSRQSRGKHLITLGMEHPAVLETCRALEKEGFFVSFLPTKESGIVDPAKLEEAIRRDTVLISVMAANHEIGTLQPISRIGEIAKERDILFHTDAVQAFGQIEMDVKEMGVDMLSASAHKIGGPKGVGFLYVKRSLHLAPMLFGGGQERGLRSGTENVAGIVGFAAAARERFGTDFKQLQGRIKKMEKLRDYMIHELTKRIPNCRLTGDARRRLPGNIHLRFEGIEAHQLVLELSKEGIYVSAGSACHSHEPRPSHVLKAMGCSHKEAYSGLRISFDADLTKADADEIIERFVKICHIG